MVTRWPEQLKYSVLIQIHSQAQRKKAVKNTFYFYLFIRLGHLFYYLESRLLLIVRRPQLAHIFHWLQPITGRGECDFPVRLKSIMIYHLVIASTSLNLFFSQYLNKTVVLLSRKKRRECLLFRQPKLPAYKHSKALILFQRRRERCWLLSDFRLIRHAKNVSIHVTNRNRT